MADQTILPYAVGRNTIDNVPAGTAGSVAGYTQITSSNDGIFQPPANGRYLISILDFTGAATVTIKATDSSGNPLNDWGAAVGDIAVTTPALSIDSAVSPVVAYVDSNRFKDMGSVDTGPSGAGINNYVGGSTGPYIRIKSTGTVYVAIIQIGTTPSFP